MASQKAKKQSSSKTPVTGGDRVSETQVRHADPGDDVEATPSRIASLRARLEPLRDAQIGAYDAMHTEAQYIEAGRQTRSGGVELDALRFLLIAEEEVRVHGEFIACKPEYLSYLDHTIVELETARAAQRAAAKGDTVTLRKLSEKEGRKVRTRLNGKMLRVAGGDTNAQAAVETAAKCDPMDRQDLRKALGKMIDLGRGWVALTTGALHERAQTFNLDTATLDAAARARNAIAERSSEALDANNTDADSPAVNLAEGKVLYAMKVLHQIFEDAHEDHPVVRRLVPGPATRRFFTSHKSTGSADAPPPAGNTPTG